MPRDSGSCGSRERAEEAGRALFQHIGEDPDRPGLSETPQRVVRKLEELLSGYRVDPVALLQRTFEEIEGYDGMVLLKDIPFVSHAEQDMGVFSGRVCIAYLPRRRVVGLSKLPRVVDALARRLQTQERLTTEIARTIAVGLEADGVAVSIEAEHQGLTASNLGSRLRTNCMLGRFQDDERLRAEFLMLVRRTR